MNEYVTVHVFDENSGARPIQIQIIGESQAVSYHDLFTVAGEILKESNHLDVDGVNISCTGPNGMITLDLFCS